MKGKNYSSTATNLTIDIIIVIQGKCFLVIDVEAIHSWVVFLGLSTGNQILGSSATSASAGLLTTNPASSSMSEERDTKRVYRSVWQRWGARVRRSTRQNNRSRTF